ncbi:hypothetical protein SK3146_06566 [Paenibacillus konkukensis]|uniref:YolD-like protein n=1 Tax=Paenibacillus konkukensis TaxID=2020716 RepID=A0ABY4S1P7_9BACL|nr:hypothetical protein SK3146_06566 [Paenibacillus konkukensis]
MRIICLEHGRETPRTGIIRDIDTVQGRIRIQSEGHIRMLRLEEVLDAEPG